MTARRAAPFLAMTLAAVLAQAGALAAADKPAWLPMMTMQIKEANGCDLVEVLHWRDVPVGENVGNEGRVRCIDGREYDFTRPNGHQKFTFRLCQPAVC